MPEHRSSPRTPMKCQVKVSHPAIGDILVNTRDISDGGIFLLTEDIEMPPIGTILTGQVQGMPVEAPVVQLEIVRVEPAGVGLRFVT
ncbi:MAG: PilZ domain-containing protein [Oleiphilus sp.]|nr:MAG: PilZ domain-containing protein [Oleiphilus sp.]